MRISDKGLGVTKVSENCILHLYNDPSNHCTIGIGHLVHEGPIDGRASELPFKNGITDEQALELLRQDMAWAEHYVSHAVSVPLTQGQFDALVDFTFNEGVGTLHKSTLLKVINTGRFNEAPAELRKYVYSGGKKLAGLVTRREREIALFTSA